MKKRIILLLALLSLSVLIFIFVHNTFGLIIYWICCFLFGWNLMSTIQYYKQSKIKLPSNPQTRSIDKLLQVFLDNQDMFFSGLCRWLCDLKTYDIISLEEYDIIKNYFKSNDISNDSYNWSTGYIDPRIEWLEKHIKLNTKPYDIVDFIRDGIR